MSELICIAFKDSGTADHELNELRAMEKEYVLDLEDAVIVVRDKDGKVHLKQCVDVFGGATTHGVALGMLWGGLIGLLFMNPLAGLLGSIAGGAGGGAMTVTANEFGLLNDYGIPDNFIKGLGNTIVPGTSAIFLLIRIKRSCRREFQNTGGRFSRRRLVRSKKSGCGPLSPGNRIKKPQNNRCVLTSSRHHRSSESVRRRVLVQPVQSHPATRSNAYRVSV
jgi:uncharacterized membrane protein